MGILLILVGEFDGVSIYLHSFSGVSAELTVLLDTLDAVFVPLFFIHGGRNKISIFSDLPLRPPLIVMASLDAVSFTYPLCAHGRY